MMWLSSITHEKSDGVKSGNLSIKKQREEDFSFHNFCFNGFTHRLERAAGSTVTVSSDLLHYTSHWTEQINLCSWPLTWVEFVWNPNSFTPRAECQYCVYSTTFGKISRLLLVLAQQENLSSGEKHFGFSSRVVRALRVWLLPWLLTFFPVSVCQGSLWR